MKDCGVNGTTIQLYLDKELSSRELDDFRAHLKECEVCRTEVEEEEELSNLLHRSRPLYSAPEALRDRVLQKTATPLPSTSYAPSRRRKRMLPDSAFWLP